MRTGHKKEFEWTKEIGNVRICIVYREFLSFRILRGIEIQSEKDEKTGQYQKIEVISF